MLLGPSWGLTNMLKHFLDQTNSSIFKTIKNERVIYKISKYKQILQNNHNFKTTIPTCRVLIMLRIL